LISANDTTILAVLSRYPDMPAAEATGYIAQIEHEENVPVGEAVVGRRDRESLDGDARRTYDEFQRWSADRTRRTVAENISARRRGKETRTALTLNRLHQKGLVTDATLLMYGISGELPARDRYMMMTPEEKNRLWAERMEARFGPNWEARFTNLNMPLPIVIDRRYERTEVNWMREGF
jgi:hypothetical protein